MKNKITIKTVFKCGDYEIMKVYDRFGNWNYALMYKGKFRIQSFDFDRLKKIAVNDLACLAN